MRLYGAMGGVAEGGGTMLIGYARVLQSPRSDGYSDAIGQRSFTSLGH